MKYYLADIVEHNANFKHTTTIRFSVPDTTDAYKAHEGIVANWYSDLKENELGWWTPCGTVACNRGKLTEIDEQVFDGLVDHITVFI